MGAGGGGGLAGANLPATGGGSAGWAAKRLKVAPGDVFEFVLGAGGAFQTVVGSNGADGGTTTIKLNGVEIISIPGAGGGKFGAAAAAVVPGGLAGALPTGGDINVAGSDAGTATSIHCSGGAGVDLYMQGGNATKSGDTAGANTSGGGIASKSVGPNRGGVQVNSSGIGETPAQNGINSLEGAGRSWLVTFSTVPASDNASRAGYGGTTGASAGLGGGSAGSSTAGRQAGRGGGGGGSNATSYTQAGGDAYAAFHFASEDL